MFQPMSLSFSIPSHRQDVKSNEEEGNVCSFKTVPLPYKTCCYKERRENVIFGPHPSSLSLCLSSSKLHRSREKKEERENRRMRLSLSLSFSSDSRNFQLIAASLIMINFYFFSRCSDLKAIFIPSSRPIISILMAHCSDIPFRGSTFFPMLL